jgi:hypothetical protein
MKSHRRTLLALFFVVPTVAKADFAWPPAFYLRSYSIWWVVLLGLMIEWIVYYLAWRRGSWATTKLTIGVNAVSALGGAIYCYGSLLFADGPVSLVMIFVAPWPLLILGITVLLEYWAGVLLFALPRSWRTALVFGGANVLSVGLTVYVTARNIGDALRPPNGT